MYDEKIFFLVFSESDSYFLSRFLMPGFRHVFAYQRTMERWLLIDGSLNSLNVLELCQAEGLDLIASHKELNPDHTILEVSVIENDMMPVWRLGPISCVSTIQYLLGIYWPLTLTPWGLYSRLLTETPSHIRIVDHGRIEQASREGSKECSKSSRRRGKTFKRANSKRKSEGREGAEEGFDHSRKKPTRSRRRFV